MINIGDHNVPRAVADLSMRDNITAASLFAVGYNYSVQLDKWSLSDQAVDYIYAGDKVIDFEIPGTLGIVYNSENWFQHKNKVRAYPLFCGEEYFRASERSQFLNFVAVDIAVLTKEFISKIEKEGKVCLVLDSFNKHTMPELRRMAIELAKHHSAVLFIIKVNYSSFSDS